MLEYLRAARKADEELWLARFYVEEVPFSAVTKNGHTCVTGVRQVVA